jgi:hypothetical protein
MKQIFVSHTSKDIQFCDAFDRICARVGIRAFRSEFESIQPPAWRIIKNTIDNSVALFFLVGKELVNHQLQKESQWAHTQNWIAYEIGLACQKGIDVWAICDGVLINFPMPYINNYLTVSLQKESAFKYMRTILEEYNNDRVFSYPSIHEDTGKNRGVACPYKDCKMEFNLHVILQPNSHIKCPQCLRDMVFTKGHLL